MILVPRSRRCRARRSVASSGATTSRLGGTRMTLGQGYRTVAISIAVLLAIAAPSLAAGVKAGFDLSSPSGGPFPSDRFTVEDPSHLTGLRVNLPKPLARCATNPTDCADINVLNTLDGF